ncbi:MAG: hypothetical protein JSR83_22415 [Proteobacteria bacterium]|nr:hypothetical protein [Pseudomonadota bacterium]
MSFTLYTLTKSGAFADPPFSSFIDARTEAATRARRGFQFVQMILNGRGDLEARIDPLPPCARSSRPVFEGTEKKSGSVVTPGLSLTGWTPDQISAVFEGAGLSAMDGTFELAEGV